MRRRRFALPGLLLGLALAGPLAGAGPLAEPAAHANAGRATPPNFVVVLTDDQRWDSLWAMPFTDEVLRSRALELSNAYVTTPECCPARASFLSGGYYAHNTGVLTNSLPNGGAARFDDRMALPVRLQRAGYQTALIGKYMNGYGEIAPRIPPGWTRFVGTVTPGNWLRFTVARGSSGSQAGAGRVENLNGYILDFQFAEALDFLETAAPPFFLLVSVAAPHEPAVPAARDAARHGGFLYRDRAYGESDLSDKPKFIRMKGSRFERNKGDRDVFHRDQLRTLAAVDRGVQALYEQLARRGQLDSTLIVLTSDNGSVWGEHRYFGKNVPYEESIRVPLLIAAPGGRRGTDDRLVAMNLDVPATVLELSGAVRSRKLDRLTDGMSLAPLLEKGKQEELEWRQDLLIEQYSRVWAGLISRTEDDAAAEDGAAWSWKYIQHGTGEEEAYRAATDPFEEESLHDDAQFVDGPRDELARRIEELRGLAIVSRGLEKGTEGVRYEDSVEVWGAAPPYVWSLEEGELPRGLELDPDTGVISGKPKERGKFKLLVKVEGSRIARYTGEFQSHRRELTLKIGAGEKVRLAGGGRRSPGRRRDLRSWISPQL